MAVAELQSEAIKWQRRINMIQGAGLNAAPITELARTDLMRLVQGGSPYSEEEITTMVYGAYTGQAQVSQGVAQNRPDNNPFHWLGNAVKDIGSDVLNYPEGIIHTVADTFNPHKWAEIEPGLAKTFSDLPNITQAWKDFSATPIVGPLSPLIVGAIPGGEPVAAGMLALNAASMGWTGFTKHPLNFMLNLLPAVDVGGKLIGAAAGDVPLAEQSTSPYQSLKEGHPFQALARVPVFKDGTQKISLETKFTNMLKGSGGAISELAFAPVWRQLNNLKRTYANAMVKGALDQLITDGILSPHMSLAERKSIVEKAMNYQSRYEELASPVNPQMVAQADGDRAAAFGKIKGDVKVYTRADQSITGAGGALDAAPVPVYFSEQEAKAAGDPNVPVEAGRVPVTTLVEGSNGKWVGNDVIPLNDSTGAPIHYTPADIAAFKKIQRYTLRYRSVDNVSSAIEQERGLIGDSESILLNDETDNPNIYRKSSLPNQKHEDYAKASKEVNAATKRADNAHRELSAQTETISRHTQKRYRWFGDTEAQTNSRPPTVPSLSRLGQAAEPFIKKILSDDKIPASIRDLTAKLDNAFLDNRVGSVQSYLAQLATRLSGGELTDYIKYLQDEVTSINRTADSLAAATGKAQQLIQKVHEADDALREALGTQQAAQKEFYDALHAQPPSAAMPLIERQVRGRVIRKITTDWEKEGAKKEQAGNIAASMAELEKTFKQKIADAQAATSREDFLKVLGGDNAEKSLAAIEQDAIHDWSQMVQAGYHPIWFHKIGVKEAENMTFGSVRPMASGKYLSAAEVDHVLDYSKREMDIGLLLPATAMEFLRSEATKQFVDYMITKSGAVTTVAKVTADLQKRFPEWGPDEIEAEIKQNFADFKPSEYSDHFDEGVNYLMPKGIKEGFDRLDRGMSRFPGAKLHRKGMKVFKVTTLSGPRHLVHVMFGGLVMQGIREPGAVLYEIAHPLEVFKASRQGILPPEVARLMDSQSFKEQILQGHYEETIDALTQVRAGKKLAEWLQESMQEGEADISDLGRKMIRPVDEVMQRLNNIENATTDFYRAAVFLNDVKHGANVETALAVAHKTLIDVSNMSPFEQTIVKQIFPFWTFTKHIMRYVFTLPADHPIRAAILANVSQQVAAQGKGWTDPLRLQRLFFLGAPDSKGRVETMDMSNLNPFRSMSSVFTIAGFLSGLAPELQTGLRILGINPLTGVPSLHQNFSYNAYTGTRQAVRPSLSPFDWIQSFVPESEIADHFLLLTDSMRTLKRTNPEAYARSFWQEINFPFALAPINIYDIRAKSAQGQYLDAQDAVSNAMRTGDVSRIRTFDAVPFEGRLYDANQVANYIQYFDNLFPGLAPRADITKPRTRRTKAVLPQL